MSWFNNVCETTIQHGRRTWLCNNSFCPLTKRCPSCRDKSSEFVEVAGSKPENHILEGESLLPILHGERAETHRDFVICEYDYSATPVALLNNIGVRDAIMFMVATKSWKLIHCEGGYRPILFDLENDPMELTDLGDSEEHSDIIAMLYDYLFRWTRRQSQRTTRSEEQLIEMRTKSRKRGVVVGIYDENDTPLELTVKYLVSKLI